MQTLERKTLGPLWNRLDEKRSKEAIQKTSINRAYDNINEQTLLAIASLLCLYRYLYIILTDTHCLSPNRILT